MKAQFTILSEQTGVREVGVRKIFEFAHGFGPEVMAKKVVWIKWVRWKPCCMVWKRIWIFIKKSAEVRR